MTRVYLSLIALTLLLFAFFVWPSDALFSFVHSHFAENNRQRIIDFNGDQLFKFGVSIFSLGLFTYALGIGLVRIEKAPTLSTIFLVLGVLAIACSAVVVTDLACLSGYWVDSVGCATE